MTTRCLDSIQNELINATEITPKKIEEILETKFSIALKNIKNQKTIYRDLLKILHPDRLINNSLSTHPKLNHFLIKKH